MQKQINKKHNIAELKRFDLQFKIEFFAQTQIAQKFPWNFTAHLFSFYSNFLNCLFKLTEKNNSVRIHVQTNLLVKTTRGEGLCTVLAVSGTND